MALHETLKNLNASQRAKEKGKEIAKLRAVPKTQRSNYEIEIVEINAIEKGVEVFARAWKNGKQIGFGKDGTVDIERFRIFNPPILVEDPNGDVIRENINEAGEKVERRLREDEQEAILQDLEHTIELVGKTKGDIIKGTIGRTTSTFYPAAGAASPVDGSLFQDLAAAGDTWANVRGATAGTSAGATSTNSSAARLRGATTSNQWRRMDRATYGFDTSPLGTDTIDSAIFSLASNAKEGTAFSFAVAVDHMVPAAADNLVVGDYNVTNWDSVRQSDTDIAIGDWSTAGYNDWTLNATGRGNINKSGNTWFGIRGNSDIDNSEPTYSTDEVGVNTYFADETGTTNDPKLVVEHTAAASGPANLKTMNTIAKANIKTINGIAIANVKSINGIA